MVVPFRNKSGYKLEKPFQPLLWKPKISKISLIWKSKKLSKLCKPNLKNQDLSKWGIKQLAIPLNEKTQFLNHYKTSEAQLKLNTLLDQIHEKLTVIDGIEYDLSKPRDIVNLAVLDLPEEQQTNRRNQLLCSAAQKVKRCPIDHCKIEYRTLIHCHTIYCKCVSCVESRVSKARKRLGISMSLEEQEERGLLPLGTKPTYHKGKNPPKALKIHSKRLYHIEIGSNTIPRKELALCMSAYIRNMRKHGYKMRYLKVFDIGRKNFHKTSKYYNHFHFALLPEQGLHNVGKFLRLSWLVLKKIHPRLLIENTTWRSKNNLLSYFAKRMAGKLGHKKEGFFYYPELMSYEEWFSNHHKCKTFTKSNSIKLDRIIGYNSTVKVCPNCEKELIDSHTETEPNELALKPPGWSNLSPELEQKKRTIESRVAKYYHQNSIKNSLLI